MRQVELFWMKISVTNKYCSLEIYYFLVFLLSLDSFLLCLQNT